MLSGSLSVCKFGPATGARVAAERDLIAGRAAEIQLNVDATRMSQAFTGSSYIQAIVNAEVDTFVRGHRAEAQPLVDLALRARFNPELNRTWFGSVMQVVSN